jgi:hypothetical protein
LVDVSKDKDVISVKWIDKTKQDADGNVHKHKERLVARGFTQQPRIDFNETFLNGNLEEKVYVEQPNNHKAMMFHDKKTKCTD